jgi:hypothetical protein
MYIVLEVGIPTDTDMDMDMDGRKPSALIESSCVWWKILLDGYFIIFITLPSRSIICRKLGLPPEHDMATRSGAARDM